MIGDRMDPLAAFAAVQALHRAALDTLGYLMQGDPARDSAQGKALLHLAAAIEAYERSILPPPFGIAGVPVAPELPVACAVVNQGLSTDLFLYPEAGALPDGQHDLYARADGETKP